MMSEQTNVVYDESKIKTLSSLEHIRTRPGMYIGRLGDGNHQDDGIYVLLKEVIDNAVDEFIMGQGRRVDVSISEDNRVTVRDFGRGIPLGKVIECVSVINTGAKYNNEVFQFSVGLNGVGTKAVNALSEYFEVVSRRDGKYKRAVFKSGTLQSEEEGECGDEPNGTEIVFRPDPDFFPDFSFNEVFVRRRLWNYAYLNSGLSLYWKGERFVSRNGLRDLLGEKVESERAYEIIYHRETKIEFAFCHTSTFGEVYYSFVNGQYTNDGGTHQSAFREGILKGINEYANKNYDGADVRNGIVGAIAVKIQEPIFESQTKNKLGNNDIRGDLVSAIKAAVAKHLYKTPETAERIIDKIAQNEKVRREVQAVRNQAKEKAKKVSLKIPKLRDCKYHLCDDKEKGAESMVFLTEGQSAAGSMICCRNVDNQAVFCLKGKPLNAFGHRFKTVYANEEFYYIMRALGIENGIESLRYEKVVIATDADVDGLHIRNLIITFFLTFFEQLVLSEHLYVLETPLYRARNKKETFYCYSDSELTEAKRKLGKAAEVTRFKGLGEISPKEFGQFIGTNIRLLPVTVNNMGNVPGLLNFFMGKNTKERRDYIMGNLM